MKASALVRHYAEQHATVRVKELTDELNSIRRVFPKLFALPKPRAAKAALKPRRRRRSMSAAERKAISARMKKYWASRRKAVNE